MEKETPDWNTIKTEYITSNISYRRLAEERGVPFRTLADHARKEGWAKARNNHRNNVARQTVRKVASRTSTENADKLLKLREAADNMSEVIAKASCGEGRKRGFGARDIKDLTGALKDLAYVIRNVYDLPTKQELSAMEIAAGRLELERARVDKGTAEESETGVVELSPVLKQEEEGRA